MLVSVPEHPQILLETQPLVLVCKKQTPFLNDNSRRCGRPDVWIQVAAKV